jgi:hypothetical protein
MTDLKLKGGYDVAALEKAIKLIDGLRDHLQSTSDDVAIKTFLTWVKKNSHVDLVWHGAENDTWKQALNLRDIVSAKEYLLLCNVEDERTFTAVKVFFVLCAMKDIDWLSNWNYGAKTLNDGFMWHKILTTEEISDILIDNSWGHETKFTPKEVYVGLVKYYKERERNAK